MTEETDEHGLTPDQYPLKVDTPYEPDRPQVNFLTPQARQRIEYWLLCAAPPDYDPMPDVQEALNTLDAVMDAFTEETTLWLVLSGDEKLKGMVEADNSRGALAQAQALGLLTDPGDFVREL